MELQSAPICHVTTTGRAAPGGDHTGVGLRAVLVAGGPAPADPRLDDDLLVGAEPMSWAGGHHDVMSAVKISNAVAGATSTTTSRRTASAIVSMLFDSSVQ